MMSGSRRAMLLASFEHIGKRVEALSSWETRYRVNAMAPVDIPQMLTFFFSKSDPRGVSIRPTAWGEVNGGGFLFCHQIRSRKERIGVFLKCIRAHAHTPATS